MNKTKLTNKKILPILLFCPLELNTNLKQIITFKFVFSLKS